VSFANIWQPALYSEAAEAADELIERFLRIPIKKAINPLDDVGFIMIVSKMARTLALLSKTVDADVVKAAMAHLDVDWANLTPAQRDAAVQAANQGIAHYYETKAAVILPKIVATLKASGETIVGDVKKHATKKWGFKIAGSFDVKDQRVIDHAAESQAHYIRDQWGTRKAGLSKVARSVVSRGLDRGAGRAEIAGDLQRTMTAVNLQRSDGYWKLIAGVFANRSRTYAALTSFTEGGITAYQFESVLDEVTSQVCRFMHGRKFDVATSLGHYQEVADSEDPEAVKEITPWVSVASVKGQPDTLYVKQGGKRTILGTVKESAVGTADETGKFSTKHDDKALQAMGVSMPPLHGHCRSTVVPIFGPSRGVVPALPHVQPQQRLGLKPQPLPRRIPLGGEPEVMLPPPQADFFGLEPATFRPPFISHGPEPAPQPAQVFIPPDYAKIAQTALDFVDLAEDGGQVVHGNPHMLQTAQQDMLFEPTKVPGAGGPIKELPASYPKPSGQKLAAVKKTPPVVLTQAQLEKLIVVGTDPYGGTDASAAMHVSAAKVRAHIKDWLDNPKPLGPILVYRSHDGALLSTVDPKDAAVIAAAKLLKQPVQVRVVDLDQYKKQQATKKPPKPKVSPADLAVAVGAASVEAPKPPPHLDATTVLHEQVGGQLGSNKGGFYIGKDGIKRYVKFYADPSQAHIESLSNGVYRALGIGAAESSTVVTPTGVVHAATALEGGQTLGTAGLTKERAKGVLQGLAADMLLGNWDVVGQSFDNVVMIDGKPYRIDTGGAVLFRAQGGRKRQDQLDQITEWDNFFNGTNPQFKELAAAAGISRPEDMIDLLREQMAKIKALKEKAGGWDKLVATMAPGFTGPDRDHVVATLEKREELLHKKIAEASKPAAGAPKPGAPLYVHPPIGGAKPSPHLKLSDLPHKPLPYVPDAEAQGVHGSFPAPGGKVVLPSGESHAQYLERIKLASRGLAPDSRSAIEAFTDSSSDIRAAETGRSSDSYAMRRSDAIARAFQHVPPEPGTVFRGATDMPQEVIDAAMRGEIVRFGHGNKGATTSTSWGTPIAKSFMGGSYDSYGEGSYKVMYVIHGKTQIPIEHISSHEHEHEVLVSRTAIFRPVSVSKVDGCERVVIIELEEIMPDDLTSAERQKLFKGLITALG
jgi:hypothetical protein